MAYISLDTCGMTIPDIEDASSILECSLPSVDVTACPSGLLEMSIVLEMARSEPRDFATDAVTLKTFSGSLRAPSTVMDLECASSPKLLL